MNLLPDPEKKMLQDGLRSRSVIATSLISVAALLISLIALTPAYFLARVRLIEVVSQTSITAKGEGSKVANTFLNLPSEIKSKLNVLESSIPKYRTAEIFYEFANAVPKEITVRSISLSRGAIAGGKKGKKLDIAGQAVSRKSLIDFSESLRRINLFSTVDVPVSSLTKERDLPFSMTIIIAE